MSNEKISEKKWFKYIVILAVMLIPFMYAFFYLRAYWNPYGEGNIDNLPVAVVNEDKGDKGETLINSIKEKKKLKLSVVSKESAVDGLRDGEYYAIINIPENFTKDMNSASKTNKKHATIYYSPNKKSNYLASQIINNVIAVVEKNLDNEVNSVIVSSLSSKINEVPSSLEKVSDGANQIKSGTNTLNNGLNTLTSGTDTIKNSYTQFDTGVSNAYDASKKLHTGTIALKSGVDSAVNSLSQSAGPALTSEQVLAIQESAKNSASLNESQKNQISNGIKSSLNALDPEANAISAMSKVAPNVNAVLSATNNCTNYNVDPSYGAPCMAYLTAYQTTSQIKTALEANLTSSVINVAETTAKESAYQTAGVVSNTVADTVKNTVINTVSSNMTPLVKGISELDDGMNQLELGLNKLSSSSKDVNIALDKLNEGSLSALNGSNKLLDGANSFKNEIDKNLVSTKTNIKKLENLDNYSKEPIEIKEEDVNDVESYGTAFAPLFISIALWVGSLMFFIILYYDKEKRFKDFGIDSKFIVKRTLLYHALASITGFILGVLLDLLLDFNITNIFLYYLSIILISNTFVAILQFLIINFNDVGKFIGLIILVLQLAASGGTFPIETVSKGFRFLNNILPMTYTIRLLKESLMSIEKVLLIKNLTIVFIIFIVFFIINLVLAIRKERRLK